MAANSGEWPMPVWCRMFQQTLDGGARGWFESLPLNSINEWYQLREAFTTKYSIRRACYKEPHEITKVVRRANETLPAFKERWTVETGLIMGVPEVMKISSFMDSIKSPELAKRFSSNIPKTVDEMMRKVDEFVRAEEAYSRTELPPGESRDIHRRLSFPTGPRDVHQRLTFPTSTRNDRDNRSSQRREYKGTDYKNPYKGLQNSLSPKRPSKQIHTPTPTPPPIPTPTPIPDTEPTPFEHLSEEPSPVHHHFSPPQAQAPSQIPMDDLFHEVPKLISRIDSLEMDLKQTKLTMGNAIMKLVKKVKKMEGFLKRRKLVLSDSEEEEPEAQGRKSQDDPLDSSVQGLVTPSSTRVKASGEEQEEDISPNTLEAAKTLSKVASLKTRSIDKGRRYKRRKEAKGKKVVSSLDFQEEADAGAEQVNTASAEQVSTAEGINTGSIKLSTGDEQLSTGNEQISTVDAKKSTSDQDKGQREGKAPMISEETPKKSKEQVLQEEASLAEAIRLDNQQREEVAKQVHLDSLLAQRIAEEEELNEQQKKRKAQVQFEAQHYTNEDWDLIRAKLEANAELTKSMLGSEVQGEDFAKKMVDLVNQRKKYFAEERARAKRNKPMTQSQLKTYMMNYLKNQGTWKLSQLKSLSFEEIKKEFDKLVKQVESFAPISFEATKASLKRFGEELQTKTPKRMKEDEDVEAKDDESTKKFGKRRKQMARKGLHTSVDKDDSEDSDEVDEQEESVTGTKTPINPVPVSMKTPSIATYKIIKQGEKEDLTGCDRIVMNRYGMNGPEDKLEKGFWKCLRIMFEEPLSTDSIWSELGQQKIISWRYYDTCRVHCLNLESMEVYMLSERKYPLSAEVPKDWIAIEPTATVKADQSLPGHTPFWWPKDRLSELMANVKEFISEFKTFSIENIPREDNQKADILSKLATVPFSHLTKEILVEVLNERSTDAKEVQTIVEEEGENWMTPIVKYLEEGIVPSDKNEARSLRSKISQYVIESGVLFKKGYLVPMLRCVGPLQANYIIREIHMGSCGMHIGPRAVVRKAMRQGYYWPTMHADAKEEVDKCDSCQIHSPIPRLPKTHMTSIMAPWPFYQWGMDILGPLTPARGGAKFVIVAIDYFTKWIEAKPLVKITGKEVIRFVMDNIICRFGLPRIMVTDNGAQLVNEPFKGWCTRFKIQQMNTSVAHPQANGLVERANRSLMEGIKTRLGRERAGWVDELPNVLWAHRTSIKQSNGETPFSLTYGSEAVIPAEIGIPSYRTLMIREEYNEEEQRLNLDLLQERREAAAIREAKYKTKMEQYYNKKVRPAGFRPGEFVYRRNEASRMEDEGKLGPNWEGPYRVTEAFENGSYKLQTMEDKVVPRTWHAVNLRKCYL
ncbi:reverse transcriptase domain-containing protein [Tanacetum coccineum]